jgi:hypothetical protein
MKFLSISTKYAIEKDRKTDVLSFVICSKRVEKVQYKAEISLKWSGHGCLSAGDYIKPDAYSYFKGFYFLVCNTNFHFFNIMTLH